MRDYLACLSRTDKNKQLSLSGDFKSIEKDIYAALKAMDWDASQSTVALVLGDKKFVVASVSTLDVLAKSKSRDFGMKIADFLRPKKPTTSYHLQATIVSQLRMFFTAF